MAATETATKVAKASVQYVSPEGEVYNFPNVKATVVRTTFANEVTRDLDVTTMNDEMRAHAVLQGFAIRTQRSYQAEKDIDKVIENYDDTVADLNNGVWIESKAGEPKVTQLAEAIIVSLEQNGQTVDADRKASIITKLKDASYREKAMSNDHVQAALANIKLEAAKARAKEAKAKLAGNKEAATELSDF